MQYYDINTGASGRARILAAGRYFAFTEGSASGNDPAVLVRTGNSGTGVILRPGQAYLLPPEQHTPDEWNITPLVAGAIVTGRILIGDGRFYDGRVTGAVEVIDGGKNRTRANLAYCLTNEVVAAAGRYPFHGIVNPAGSGKVAVVDAINVSSSAVQAVFVEAGPVPLAGTFNGPANKNVGVVGVSSMEGRYGDQAAAPAGANLFFARVQANLPMDINITEPIIVLPGNYLRAIGGTVATTLGSIFQFYEDTL